MSEATNAAAIQKIHSDLVDRLISEARDKVKGFVKPADEYGNPRLIISRYVATVGINFTDWIGKTYPWTRHELAQYALKDNLRCEQSEDHIGMLIKFAEHAMYFPEWNQFAHSKEVRVIRQLLSNIEDAGLTGLIILAILENTSEVFIPVLEKLIQKFHLLHRKTYGSADLTYTQAHGKADAKHSDAFTAALKAEWTMGYRNHEGIVFNASNAAVNFLRRIFEETPIADK
ncbi:hypothetical protein KW783_02590 [Candidatus Parcubacteria bacterium]|nr:hypothetical protein [Candidatus Parcubacteria bacterium]